MKNHFRLVKPSKLTVSNQVDAIEIIRQKSISGYENDEPLYICNISDLIRKHQAWIKYMPRVKPFYAVKCNNDPVVIQTLAGLGTGFDCASKGEIAMVMSMGVSNESIIYANPNKPISHLKFASKMKVDLMTVDNELELYKIAKHFPSARLLLRIRYDAKIAQYYFGKKFGCDATTEAPELIKLARSLQLNMVGICFHVGSDCKQPEIFSEAIQAARNLFDVAENVGYHFNLVDIGGGFSGRKCSDIKKFASIINDAIDSRFPSSDVRIIAEPGRYYVESAFTFACQVHSIREVRKNGQFSSFMYFINDGVFGSFAIKRYQDVSHPLTLKSAKEKMFTSSVWGPCLSVDDQIYENILLPKLEIEDFLIFERMGAYAIPLATEFNGISLPKVEYYIKRKHWYEATNRTLLEQ